MRRALTRILIGLLILVPAFAAGYAVSRQFGPDLMRAELESALSKLLEGEVRIEQAALLVRGGLQVAGTGLSAYPQKGAEPALVVDSAVAEIDLVQLALGQFRLTSLRVEGASFRIEHLDDDQWSPAPIAALADEPTSANDLERQLVLLRAVEKATRWLLEKPIVARRFELIDSEIQYFDSKAPVPAKIKAPGPYQLTLESIDGELVHHWISGQAELNLRAKLRNAAGVQGRIEIDGRHRPDDRLQLSVAGTAIELSALAPYTTQIDKNARMSGVLSGVVGFDTLEPDHGRLELDWVTHQIDALLPFGEGKLVPVQTARGTLEAEIEVHPGRLRLSSAELAGSKIRVDLSGAVERPLRESSPLRIRADIEGIGLEEGRRFVAELPEEDRETLRLLLERIQAGQIEQMGGTGIARISQWRRLLSGRLRQLPPGFVLRATLAAVTLATGETDVLRDVGGRIEWSADRFEVREAGGRWNDFVLPKLSAVVEGASNLFESGAAARKMRNEASALPGLRTLLDVVFSRDPNAPRDSHLFSGVPPALVRFKRLDHPVLRWPIDDAVVHLTPNDVGAQINLSAQLAGAPIRAEAIWQELPEESIDIYITVAPTGDAQGPAFTTASPRLEGTADAWALGDFEVGGSKEGRFPFDAIAGEFVARGDQLLLDDIRVDLPGGGILSGRAGTDLGRADVAGIDLAFQISDAQVATLAHALEMPPDIATGVASASGAVRGDLRVDQPLLEELQGSVDFAARDGVLQVRIPLVVAIAQATEGFNPLAEREEVHYETATARLELANNRISTDRFTLEGPMRVFANGEIVLDGKGGRIDAVVGVFLFRQMASTIGTIPLLGALISDKGLLGAYYSVEGELSAPAVKALPLSSLAEAVPDVIKAPIKMLGFVFKGPKQRAEEKRKKKEDKRKQADLPPIPASPRPSSPDPTREPGS